MLAACALVAAFAVGLSPAASVAGAATSKPPRGYRTLIVKEAGISIAVPKSWVTLDPARKDFEADLKKLRKKHPRLAETFLAQERARAVLKEAVLYVGDPAGEKFHDNVSILNIRGVTEPPTEEQIRDALSGLPEVETKPTTVAGVEAVEAAYQNDVNTTDGETLTTHLTQYAFLGKKGGVAITFTGLEDGRQHPTFQRMIGTVKLRR
ncbi:MAG TPA: hypothetical protein VGK05_08030 [Acidimicrobiia bacterium]